MGFVVFSEYALLWAGGFLLVYVAVQLGVSRLPLFQNYSAIQKSIAVKVIALLTFVLAYGVVKIFI